LEAKLADLLKQKEDTESALSAKKNDLENLQKEAGDKEKSLSESI